MSEKHKYICEKCNFKCNHESRWNQHIETELHKTGKKKTRSDKKFDGKCKHCEFIAKNNINMQQHVLSFHSTKEERKAGFKYYCEHCDYGTFAKTFFDKHNGTSKHKTIMDIVNKQTTK
jgi:hypothetical protein